MSDCERCKNVEICKLEKPKDKCAFVNPLFETKREIEKFTRTITERDLENAVWHFNNNMTAIMQLDRQQYQHARADIAYLLELYEPHKIEKTEACSQACPRCGWAVNRHFCPNCGQRLLK